MGINSVEPVAYSLLLYAPRWGYFA